MLVDGCDALHTEFVKRLTSQKDGPRGMAKWASDRANGHWYQTIVLMLEKLMGPDTGTRLKLTMPSASHVFRFDPNHDALKRDAAMLNEYGSLVLNLICNRAWSQVHFGLVFPYCLARILSDNETHRKRARLTLKQLCQGILKLEDCCSRAAKNSMLHKLLTDVGTNDWVIVREIFIEGAKVDWNPDSEVLRGIAMSLHAGPSTTKYCLENVINTVKDAALRSSKNQMQMSTHTKWFYAATSSHAEDGGVQQIQVDKHDIAKVSHNFNDKMFAKQRCWEAGKATFHEVVPKPQEFYSEMRKAGYLANKQAASAAAFILRDSEHDFSHVSKAWAGLAWWLIAGIVYFLTPIQIFH